MRISYYKNEIMKIAKKEDDGNFGKKALGAGLVLGGAGTVNQEFKSGNLTGRETLYHNTRKSKVGRIKDKGLKASFASDPKNLTNTVLTDLSAKDKEGKVYLGRSKSIADKVTGIRAAQMHDARFKVFKNRKDLRRSGMGTKTNLFTDVDTLDMKPKSMKLRETVKANVPTWKLNQVDNPELRGAKNFTEYAKAKGKLVPDVLDSIEFRMLDKGTATVQGDVSPKYIKGSKHYSKNSPKEILDYVKNNKKRFAKGAGKSLAGLAATGLGLSLLKNKEKER